MGNEMITIDGCGCGGCIVMRGGMGDDVFTSTDEWEDRYIHSKERDVKMSEIEEYSDIRESIKAIESERRE